MAKITAWDREPTTLTDEFGIVWTEQYSVWQAYIGGIIRVQVSYDNGGYQIRVEDRVLKNNAGSAEKGRQRAVAYVKQQLRFLFNGVK